MATKKKFKKMIKNMVEAMPLIMTSTSEEHRVKGSELIAQGNYDTPDGKLVEPDKVYVQHMPVQIAFNHENRLKRIFKQHGKEGVTGYISKLRKIVQSN